MMAQCGMMFMSRQDTYAAFFVAVQHHTCRQSVGYILQVAKAACVSGEIGCSRPIVVFGGCMPVVTQCLVCGKEIKVKPSHAAKGAGKYCSRECMATDYKTRLSGEANPNYKSAGRHICPTCGKEFVSYQKWARYCSVACRANAPEWREIARQNGKRQLRRVSLRPHTQHSLPFPQRNKRQFFCSVCGKEILSYVARDTCSRECANKARPKQKVNLPCVICGKEFTVYKSVAEHGNPKVCSRECLRVHRSLSQQGEKSHRWQGGRTKQTLLDRQSLPYKMWRESVFARDGFTCQLCGVHGGRLTAHHIKTYAKHPQYRRDVGNGITLCKSCHVSIKNREEEYEARFFAITGGISE